MTTDTEKPHLSISALNMLNFCGEQYRRRYVLGERIPPGVAAAVGRATDKSVSHNLQSKIDTGELLSLEEVRDLARDEVNAAWERGNIRLTDEELAAGTKRVKGEATDKAVRLSELHANAKAPELQPTHVQRNWVLDIDGYDMQLTGWIDVQEGSKSVRDTKTARRTPNRYVADSSEQLTTYALAVSVIDGKAPDEVVLDYLVDNKTPVVKSFVSKRDPAHFQALLNRLENAMLAIERGVFVPVRGDHFLCSERFCGYHSTCPYVRRGDLVQIGG